MLDQWAYLNGVALDFSRPGKPIDNTFIEVFNGQTRQKCLNENWFLSRRIPGIKWRGDERSIMSVDPMVS
ncbi:MAG: transposase [Chloroflexi bacterium]|nr:transposase [Chloroflexota bacterium]